MKKKLLMMMLFALMGATAFAQDGAKLASSPELSGITSLTDLAAKISQAETAAATTSRSGAAGAQEKVRALYDSYSKELANQKSIHAADKKIVAAITAEETLVKSKIK